VHRDVAKWLRHPGGSRRNVAMPCSSVDVANASAISSAPTVGVTGAHVAYVQDDLLTARPAVISTKQARGRRASGIAVGTHPDCGFASVFVTCPDGLTLHVRRYGPRLASALPVVCLPGLARTAADFHPLAAALATEPAKPRLVLALDYRGHGQSEYDRNPDKYTLSVALADLSAVLTALEIAPAIFVGTSYGGVLTMMLAVWRPTAIAGVILNDIGPVIEFQGLVRIKDYVRNLPTPRNFEQGAEILSWWFRTQFPKLAPQDWIAFAKRTWREHGGRLVPDYDLKIARTLQGANLERPPTLWNQFDALARVPLMVIRGANSDMLAPTTLDAMLARRGELEVAVVPDQGHAPLLAEAKLIRQIAAFVASCDVSARR
jgi:pimeloyl-ACP methyl ester carboxylesterase